MATDVAVVNGASKLEQVLISGNLAQLSPEDRVTYYKQVCESLNLNPLTRPFDYLQLSGKLTLYAKRDAADQLRKLHGVSIDKPDITFADGLVTVVVTARDAQGRTDTDLGAVAIDNLKGEARANAIMKCITKAKRRVTLAICGLGWLDETEIDSIPGAKREPAEPPQQSVPQALPRLPVAQVAPAATQPASDAPVTFQDMARRDLGLMPEDIREVFCSNSPSQFARMHQTTLETLYDDLRAYALTGSPIAGIAGPWGAQRFWDAIADLKLNPEQVEAALGCSPDAYMTVTGLDRRGIYWRFLNRERNGVAIPRIETPQADDAPLPDPNATEVI